MLADKELLKTEIGTSQSDAELGINRSPEAYPDPKQAIESAIRIARQSLTKRRRHDLSISELYLPVGQKIPLGTLYRLHSYQKFKKAIINAFKNFNYLHE